MMTPKAVPFDEVFADIEKDEEFKKADRQLKPYYDLVMAIIKRRNELRLTQKDLAERANTHQSRISKIESAEHDIRLSTLVQIAEALDTEVSIRLVPIGKNIPVSNDEYTYSLFNSSLDKIEGGSALEQNRPLVETCNRDKTRDYQGEH
jgi:transcriptional regulator with XRE-family HTH domain